MAANLTIEQLRELLRSPEAIRQDPFAFMRQICGLANDSSRQETAREMILRALEHRQAFGGCELILDAVARSAGFFPYVDPANLGFRDRLAYECHRPDDMPDDIVFHRQQAEVYWRLMQGDSVILSAPTSFGKSRIIDAVVAARRHRNIAVIVPTLALIDETRRRLFRFSDRYKIITHLSQLPAEWNIFVLTAERAVQYERFPRIDFLVIDEFYKLGAMDQDSERTVALNEVFYRLRKGGGQFYLLGPSIERIPSGLEEEFRCYFYHTNYATVVADEQRVPGNKKNDVERLIALVKTLEEPTIVFCKSPASVNAVAHAFVDNGVGIGASDMEAAAEWVAREYHGDWVFGKALVRGIGIHHGRLPRALSQYVVRMFNDLRLRFLICTSTLIEGVNTKAKNVVIFDNEIANRQLDYFTFNNIKGRSGRMFEHFVGRVYLFHNPPQRQLPFVDFPLFTQHAGVPNSLLVQLDDEDLSKAAAARIRKYSEQSDLPMQIIRQNSTVDPDAQVELAREIVMNATRYWRQLAWDGFPTYPQLEFACGLIWNHFVKGRRSGVASGSQLAFKVMQLQITPNVHSRILAELRPGPYAARGVDEAVERVLEFDRNWAGFYFPHYLMALSRIQNAVFSRLGYGAGDYTAYASRVECLFRSAVIAALEEYGVPIQLAERVQPLLGAADDLDAALSSLRSLDLGRISLDGFERDVLTDAQRALLLPT